MNHVIFHITTSKHLAQTRDDTLGDKIYYTIYLLLTITYSYQSYKFEHSFLKTMLSVFAYARNEGNISLNWSTTDQFWQYHVLWMNWQQLECKLR